MSKSSPRRRSSRFLALAAIAIALAAAPTAGAIDYLWEGGGYDNWGDSNWNLSYLGNNFYSNDLIFGEYTDSNGVINNDIGGQSLDGLYFSNQNWTLTGDDVDFHNGSINVAASSPTVSISNLIDFNNTLINNSTLTVNVAGTSLLTLSGTVVGSGALNKIGSGTVLFTGLLGTDNWAGGTFLNGGRLITYEPVGSYTDNAILEIRTLEGDDTTYGGGMVGAGSFVKSGGGYLTLTGLSDTYTGGTTVSEGYLIDLHPHGDYADNASLEFKVAGVVNLTGAVSGAGSLTKSGAGYLTFSGLNSYTGGTTISGGTLIDVNPHGNYIDNAYLQFQPTSFNSTYSGTISGTGALTYSGAYALYLTGVNTYTGGTSVNSGTLVDDNPHGTYGIAGTLQVNTGGRNLTSSGLIYGTGSFSKSDTGSLTLTAVNTYTGGTLVDEGTLVDLYPHGNYKDDAALVFQVDGSQSYSGFVSGPGSLTKSGSGVLVLLVPDSYSGATTVSAGTLVPVFNNALPTSTDLTVNAGAVFAMGYSSQEQVGSLAGAGSVVVDASNLFAVSGTTSTTFSGVVSSSGGLTKAGSSTLTLTGVNTYTGGTTVSGGSLIDANPHGSYVTNGTGVLDFQDATNLTYATPITGTGAFAKSGAGTLTLSGVNTYSNGTTVSAGTLIDQHPQGNYVDNATLAFSPPSDLTYVGTISGTGSFLKSGSANIFFFSQNSYSGSTTVSGGELYLEHSTNTLPTTTALILNGGTLSLEGNAQTVASLSGSSVLDLSGGTFTVNGSSSTTYSGAIPSSAGSFVKSGTGTLTLTGQNLYTGGTTVSGGTLVDANPHGSYVDNAALEFNDASALTYATAITGSGSFTKIGAGTLTLSGVNTYSGGATVTTGRLIDLNPHGSYVDNAALEFNDAANLTDALTITGTGSFTKSGAGTLTLSGVNTYSGGSTVSAGTLNDQHPHGNYVDNAILDFSLSTNYSGVISGSGSFVVNGSNSNVFLNSPNTYGGSTTVSAGELYLEQNGILPTATALILNGGTLSLDGHSQTVASLSGSSRLDFKGGAFTVNGSSSTTYSGQVPSSAGSLVKSGSGTLALSGQNLYTAGTTVSAGTLIDANPHGSYIDNAALQFNDAANLTYALPITGTGSFTKIGAGALTLSAVDTYSGGTTVTTGRLVDFSPHGSYTDNAALEFNDATNLTYALAISGTGSFTKSGAGALTRSGSNTYSGGTTVSAGRLVDQKPSGSYVDNAALEFNDASDLTYAPPITGTGSFTKSGARALTLLGMSTYSGGTTVSAGSLIDDYPHGNYAIGIATLYFNNATALTYGGAITGTGAFASYGNLTLTGANTSSGGTYVYGGRLIDQNPHGFYDTLAALEFSDASDLTDSNTITGSGSFTKSGAGTLTLSGNNDYTGGTTVNAGLLIDQNPHGSYVDNAALEFANAGSLTFAPAITGTGSFTKVGAGTLTLSGVDTYSGGTTVNAGLLIDQNPHGSYADNAALEFAVATNQGVNGAITGAGTLTKSGAGVLSLTNAPANTGGVHVSGGSLSVATAGSLGGGLTVDAGATVVNASGGTLTVGGRSFNQGQVNTATGSTTIFTGLVSGAGLFAGAGGVDFNGGFSPGNSPASVTIQGDMTLGAADMLTMELAGTTQGTGYDHLNVQGTANLGGALDVVTYGGFTAGAGQTFDLFDFAHETGTFTSITLPTLAHGLAWDTSGLYTDGKISVHPQVVPEPESFVALGLGALAFLRRRRKA